MMVKLIAVPESAVSKMVHYLTLQDVLWINHEVTKKVNEFKHAQLEEAVFFQYGYGKSEDVIGQAGQFLQGFLRLRPFSWGNRATALISVLAFLSINGFDVNLSPEKAAEWAMAVARREKSGVDAIKEVAVRSARAVELTPPIRTTVRELVQKYASVIETLTDD